MHQEIHESDPGKGGRLRLFFALLFALLLVRLLMGFTVNLPYAGIIQALMLALPFALLMWVYKRRLCAYRYTVFHREPGPDEVDQYGDPVKLPYPLGTVIFERISGKRAKVYELIPPAELRALLPPGQPLPPAVKGAKPLLAAAGKKSAHALAYRRGGALRALYFCPTAELAAILDEIIRAVNYCGEGE